MLDEFTEKKLRRQVQDNGYVTFPNTVGGNLQWQPNNSGGNGALWMPPNSIIMINLMSSYWGNDMQINTEASFFNRFNSSNSAGKKWCVQGGGSNTEYLTVLYGGTSGSLGINNTNPTSALDVTGDIAATGKLKLYNSSTPATSGATGTTGQITWDANYVYVCTATNTWKRAALSSW